MSARLKSYQQEAVALLGQRLVRQSDEGVCSGTIVEVELYHQDDPSSHSFNGMTARNQSMFLPAGHAYVYLSYGIHRCLNVSLGEEGEGVAALIRALKPETGQAHMARRRNVLDVRSLDTTHLCSGPGKLTQALDISAELNGHDLTQSPLQLQRQAPLPASDIVTTTRIGISKAADAPLRFYIKDSPFVSRY